MSKNELAILGLLSEGEKYGYQIHQEISERHMDVWAKISISSIYNTLNKLKEMKMVETRKLKVGNTPERRIYRITPGGKNMLDRLVESYLDTRDMGDYPFGLGVAFIYSLPRGRAVELIGKRVARLELELETFEEKMGLHERNIPINWFLLIKNGRNHIESELLWCRELLHEMKKTESWKIFCTGQGETREGGEAHEPL